MELSQAAPALQRILTLVDAESQPRLRNGYLDFLPAASQTSHRRAQSLWHTRIGATTYDRILHPIARVIAPYTRRVPDRLELGWGASVLDIGCGPGNLTVALAKAVGPDGLAIGLDISASMLDRAVKRSMPTNTGYLRADAERLPLREAVVDAASCALLLHLVDDVGSALDQVARVLRPGGRIALSVTTSGYGFSRSASRWLGSASGARMFEPDELPTLLAERGFVDIRSRTAGLLQSVDARRSASRQDQERHEM